MKSLGGNYNRKVGELIAEGSRVGTFAVRDEGKLAWPVGTKEKCGHAENIDTGGRGACHGRLYAMITGHGEDKKVLKLA